MAEDIKKKYYSLNKDDFDKYLSFVKNDDETIKLFSSLDKEYFFYPNGEYYLAYLSLKNAYQDLKHIFLALSKFGQNQIIQSIFIDEIKATNEIEDIVTTRHDIFYLLNKYNKNKKNKIKSIVNIYSILLSDKDILINNHHDIKNIYEKMMNDAYENKEDKLDGLYYRKNQVYITNGIKDIHQGFFPEEKIISSMNELINIYNSNIDTFLKAIIVHFMLETIHPFYDGNGRFGRLLMSFIVSKESLIASLLISSSFNKNKRKYYKALEIRDDFHQFGSINEYVIRMIKLLTDGFNQLRLKLNVKQKEMKNHSLDNSYTKAERKVYSLLVEGSLFSYFGLNEQEIIKETKLSKRTVVNCVNRFNKEGLIIKNRIAKYNFIKIKDLDFLS